MDDHVGDHIIKNWAAGWLPVDLSDGQPAGQKPITFQYNNEKLLRVRGALQSFAGVCDQNPHPPTPSYEERCPEGRGLTLLGRRLIGLFGVARSGFL